MTGEEQRNTIAAFAEYLKKEDVCFFILAYKSNGDLTCVMDANDDLPNALACAMSKNGGDIEEALAMALAINAEREGRLIQINDNQNEN